MYTIGGTKVSVIRIKHCSLKFMLKDGALKLEDEASLITSRITPFCAIKRALKLVSECLNIYQAFPQFTNNMLTYFHRR